VRLPRSSSDPFGATFPPGEGTRLRRYKLKFERC